MSETGTSHNQPFIVVQLVAGVVFYLLFYYTIHTVVSPFFLFASIIVLLYSVRSLPFARVLLIISSGFFIVWSFQLIANALSPFILSIILAYLLNPFVQRLEKRSVPRWISSLLLLAVVVGFLLLSLGKIIPIALAQITELIHNSSGLSESIRAFVTSNTIFALLRNINVPVDELQEKIQSAISSSAGEYFTSLLAGTKNLFSMVAAMFSHILNIVLVPFLTFYLLKDFPRIQEYVQSWIPESKKETSITLVNKINVLLSEYVRGALTVAFILGTLIGISYSIFGIPYAIVIGMMMIPLYFVPFFGYFSITAFSIIAVLLSGEPTLFLFLVVFITMGIIILSDMVVLSPKFIGEKVGIHPVLLVFSLFVFSILFGFIGLVLALPVTAIILLLVEEWRNYLKKAESF